jgi:hypothetical protein
MKKSLLFAALLVLAFPMLARSQQASAIPGNPLVDDDGWELVYGNCSGCHSLALVVGQRGDRGLWLRLIRWMQDTQNLWQFDPEIEDRILTYLATNYSPGSWTRRAPLPAELLPPRDTGQR